MAVRLESNKYQGRYVYAEVWESSYNEKNNTSDVSWKIVSTGGQSTYYSTGPTELWIGSTRVYYKSRVEWNTKSFPASKGEVSGTINGVKHNDNGALSLNITFKTAVYYYAIVSKSGTLYLTTIDQTFPTFADGYPKVWPVSATSAGYQVKVSTGGSTYSTVINNTTANDSHPRNGHVNNELIGGYIGAKPQVNWITITSTKDNNGLSVSKTLDVDCSRPDVTFSITPTGLSTADGYIKCSNYDFKYQVDNGSFSSNSTPVNTNAIYKFTNLRNIIQTHTARTRRSTVDIDSIEASYEVDMRLPTISNTSIVANTTTSGTLTYKCDLSGTAYWYDNNNNLLNSWAVTGSNNAQTRVVTLLENESGNTTYRLKIARNTYDVLYSQTSVYGNTQTNTATIKNVDAAGTSMTVYVDISGSVKGCPTAKLYNIQHYSDGSNTVDGIAQSDGTYKFEFKNLPINVPMTLRLNIVNSNSGLTSVIERNQTVEGEDLICRGVVYINTNGTPEGWKMGVVYVNTTGTFAGWKGGAPYINTDGTAQGWTFGTLNE